MNELALGLRRDSQYPGGFLHAELVDLSFSRIHRRLRIAGSEHRRARVARMRSDYFLCLPFPFLSRMFSSAQFRMASATSRLLVPSIIMWVVPLNTGFPSSPSLM
jgi:hypothetical protein